MLIGVLIELIDAINSSFTIFQSHFRLIWNTLIRLQYANNRLYKQAILRVLQLTTIAHFILKLPQLPIVKHIQKLYQNKLSLLLHSTRNVRIPAILRKVLQILFIHLLEAFKLSLVHIGELFLLLIRINRFLTASTQTANTSMAHIRRCIQNTIDADHTGLINDVIGHFIQNKVLKLLQYEIRSNSVSWFDGRVWASLLRDLHFEVVRRFVRVIQIRRCEQLPLVNY